MPKLGEGVEKRVCVKVYLKPEAQRALEAHARKKGVKLSVWAGEAMRRQYEAEK